MTSKEREALKALIHEMEYVLSCINAEEIPFDGDDFHEALRLGKEALDHLAQPEQRNASEYLEPVAWIYSQGAAKVVSMNYVAGVRASPLYTTPPQRTAAEGEDTRRAWVGLDEIDTYKLWKNTPLLIGVYTYADVAKEVEALLKEKNA